MLRTLPKNQLSPNHWAFIAGSDVALLPEPASAEQRAAACQQALQALLLQLASKPACFPVLEKKLVMLEGADGSIVVEELLMILKQAGLQAEQADAEALVAGLPSSKARRVDSKALLRCLREQQA